MIEVCVQCHGNAIRHKGPALSYRPGEPLANHYRTVTPKFSEDDHVADQITRLRQSKCFQNSEMTCITCHDPHLTSDAPHGMTFRETCTQCHESQACKQRDRLPTEVADKCVQCHMRKFAKVNVNFDTAHDSYVPPVQRSQHQIAVDPVATQEVLLSWYQTQSDDDSKRQASMLQQALVDHWLKDGAALATAGRYTAASAAMRELLRIAPDSAEGQSLLQQYTRQQREFDDLLNQAEHLRNTNRDRESLEMFQRVLKIRPDNSKAIGRIGAIYYKLGDRQQAESYLSRVAEVDPDDQYGLSMMAWNSLNIGEFARAVELYERADAIEPYNSKLNGLWGIALIKDGRTAAGIKRLLVACESDPKNLQAIRELVKVHVEQQQFAIAETWAIKAVQLTGHQKSAGSDEPGRMLPGSR